MCRNCFQIKFLLYLMSTARVVYLFPTVLMSHTVFLQNISMCYNCMPIYGSISLEQNKIFFFFQINLLHQPNQTETGYFQVRICSLCALLRQKCFSDKCSALHDAATWWCPGAAVKTIVSIVWIVEFSPTRFLRCFL